jgi:hypothetical protein
LGLPGGRFPYDSPVDVDRWIKTVMAVMVFFYRIWDKYPGWSWDI